jgi:para-nitrobenzyl esterase
MFSDLLRAAAIIGLLVVQPVRANPTSPVVRTAVGPVQGSQRNGVQSFLGIPYAASPAGQNRWRAPQPLPAWTRVRDATRFGPSCWQAVAPQGFGPWSHEYVVQGEVAEDCLLLNVWTPVQPRRAPVLFWIHGGGFNSGSGSIPIYDGTAFARRGIVVVTINYRVNVSGFLAHPELGTAANFGLLDVIAALRWTRDNIARFGGDPARVTIAGQSAGAAAVHDLIASPLARGLFARAIAQSGLPVGRPMTGLATAQQQGLTFARKTGASSLVELRKLVAETLQPSHGSNAVRFTPVIDGHVLPLGPDGAIEAGRSADIPVLAGFNADEGSSSATYPTSDPELERDRWRANLEAWASLRATSGRAPTYAYYFSRVSPGPQAARWRAFHSSEIPYVFGTFSAAPERGYTTADAELSETMAHYWANFVRAGDPNGAGLPKWPAYRTDRPALIEFGDAAVAEPIATPEKLRIWRGQARASTP